MISNERPSPYGFRSHKPDPTSPLRPKVEEDVLKIEVIQIERKTFTLTLKENDRGRFLRITEQVGGAYGRRNNLIIPSTGLEEFRRILGEMVEAARK
jgi:hypothetical protein